MFNEGNINGSVNLFAGSLLNQENKTLKAKIDQLSNTINRIEKESKNEKLNNERE
jgi:outer membrane murein-binding lipoprotein Lpp